MTEVESQNEDQFETEATAIASYESYNPARRVIRWGMEDTPVELKTIEENGETKRYLILGPMKLWVSEGKDEIEKLGKKLAHETSIGALFEPESVHFSPLVRKHLKDPDSNHPKIFLVLTGIPKSAT